ncbi:MAG TPA: CRISPR-associated protein Cas4 [Fimbriimonadales bacterium]|nr:CRISPR-associated protein Cas4 [Fimbriimonadales bacterium]
MQFDDWVNISELRQWLYCPRVVWHQRVLGCQRPTTASMEDGKSLEEERRSREKRRSEIVGIPGRKFYNVYLFSKTLKLVGVCDMVLELWQDNTNRIIPIEWKATSEKLDSRHRVQLAGYGMLLREAEGQCDFGLLVSLPSMRVESVIFDAKICRKVLRLRDQIIKALREATMPEPTPNRAKCMSCEFKRFCNDIW